MPPNDYPDALDGPDQIYVSETPLFSPEECDRVVAMAEAEGAGLPGTRSGKYQLGKAWIKDMPGVLEWFNGALRGTLFPTLAGLFPALVSDASQLRAHSVAVLKYNSTHPRTDVHVDDALLAFTIALSPASSFEGGGTYFEHIDRVLHMPQVTTYGLQVTSYEIRATSYTLEVMAGCVLRAARSKFEAARCK